LALVVTHPVADLYTDHHGWLHAWLRGKLGCAHQAADLAHDTFVRLLVRPRELGGEPRALLTHIAKGLVIDHWRRQELERAYCEALAHLPEPQVPSAETQRLMLDALVQIDALLDGLGPKVRAAFLLSRLEGRSYPEIAREIGVSLSSVEKYMATALRHLLRLRAAQA
jgi:RNA polymerase sigma-70 factor (ECF subfamily)